MTVPSAGATLPLETLGSIESLEVRYRAYCRGQASALLALLPREAIRPLHREARAWATEAAFDHDPTEPLETLLAYCQELMPLPPFAVWRDDLRRNPLAHAELATPPAAHDTAAESAVTLAARAVEHGGVTWDAGLRVFAAQGAWRGYIVFRSRVAGRHARTAAVFREEGPDAVRTRFMDLAPATLAAFLRSSLP